MKTPILMASVCLALAGIGCGPSDTSDGFKPPPTVSKADIQKQIDSVSADPSIQPGPKQMVIANLKKKLASAQ